MSSESWSSTSTSLRESSCSTTSKRKRLPSVLSIQTTSSLQTVAQDSIPRGKACYRFYNSRLRASTIRVHYPQRPLMQLHIRSYRAHTPQGRSRDLRGGTRLSALHRARAGQRCPLCHHHFWRSSLRCPENRQARHKAQSPGNEPRRHQNRRRAQGRLCQRKKKMLSL